MKNRNKAGFTLSETLTTVLLIGIIFAAVAGGVVVLRNAYESITVRADAQALLSTTVTQVSADLNSATMSMTKDKNTYYFCTNRGAAIRYETEAGSTTETTKVLAYNGDEDYLVTSGTSTKKLAAVLEGFGYNSSENLFTVTIKVYDKNTKKELESTELKVRPYIPVVSN
jgi:prepilin-type N-terminal cleavage/methylation domain-containing protein